MARGGADLQSGPGRVRPSQARPTGDRPTIAGGIAEEMALLRCYDCWKKGEEIEINWHTVQRLDAHAQRRAFGSEGVAGTPKGGRK